MLRSTHQFHACALHLSLCPNTLPVLRRSMYAVAANCPKLEVLRVSGYNEHITDGGISVLLEACSALHTVKLSSKLLKVHRARGGSLL